MVEKYELEKLRSQFGLFSYENEAFVDSAITSEKHIEIHENVHMILSKSTSYGLFISMLKKALVMDRSKEWVKDILASNMKKMQECIATSIEYLSILKNNGYETYLIEYKQLKLNNRTYFNYLKNVSWLMETATEQNVELYMKVLETTGRISLQIDINAIPEKVFTCEKEMKKFNNDIDNSLLYNPDIRFKKLIKCFQYVLQNDSNNFGKYLDSVHKIIESTIDYSDKYIYIIRKTIEKVFKNSVMLNKIIQRTSTYKQIEISSDYYNDDTYNLCIYPTNLNEKNKIDYDIKNMNTFDFIEMVKKKSDGYLHILNRIAGLENFHMFSYINPITGEFIITQFYNLYDINRLLNQIYIPIVFDEKKRFIDYKNILDINKIMYVFMESAIFYNSSFIRDYFNDSIYTIIYVDGYNCICIKKGRYIMLQLISPNAIQSLKKFIIRERLNINYMELGISGLYKNRDEICNVIHQHINLINYSLRVKKDL